VDEEAVGEGKRKSCRVEREGRCVPQQGVRSTPSMITMRCTPPE